MMYVSQEGAKMTLDLGGTHLCKDARTKEALYFVQPRFPHVQRHLLLCLKLQHQGVCAVASLLPHPSQQGCQSAATGNKHTVSLQTIMHPACAQRL